jgi:hypothetical protein
MWYDSSKRRVGDEAGKLESWKVKKLGSEEDEKRCRGSGIRGQGFRILINMLSSFNRL